MKSPLTDAQIKKLVIKEIHNLDKKLPETDKSFETAKILLSSVFLGTNVKRISKVMEIPIKQVKMREDNLRKNNVWIGEKVAGSEWFEKNGGVAFWLDTLVADGLVKRSPEEPKSKARAKFEKDMEKK